MSIVLFDLDGTLTDPGEGITKSVAYALKRQGIVVDDLKTLECFIGPPLKDSFMQFYGMTEEDAWRAVEDYREYFRQRGMYENKPYAGIEPMLAALCKQGKRLAIATSKPEIFAKQIAKHFHIDTYFNGIFGSNLDGSCVKKAEVIAKAMQALSVKDAECCMVGDRDYDILGAKEMHIYSIGVLYGYGTEEEHLKAKADEIAADVAQLRKILEKRP